MNVLFVASECAPFVKTGGLADVIGSVPKALEQLDNTVKILIPAYPALKDWIKHGDLLLELEDLFGGPARVYSVRAKGLNLLLLEAAHLFDRKGTIYLDEEGYDWEDNAIRFGALSLIGAKIGLDGIGGWKPDVINAHDWQAGLVPVYLRQSGRKAPPVVMTIHNIAFQGLFDGALRGPLGLSSGLFTPDGFEYWGHIGYLKGGIAMADKITTVSPTYAEELLTPEFGMGLEGLLRSRQSDLTGILNGIDLDIWNPETDKALTKTFTAKTLKRKAANRTRVEEKFGLASNPDAPLFCVISRLTTQKGLDLLLKSIPTLIKRGARLAVLGTGDKKLEDDYRAMADRFPESVSVEIGYDEELSHMLQGGSDAILIPSRFEPCGLTQLYGLRYGTIPVVARTGGLADTVIDANSAALTASCATGIQFSPITIETLEKAINRTCDLFKEPKHWRVMMRRAMEQEVGWDHSAKLYKQLFSSLIEERAD
ncbi:glycogen synthase GlgA [Cohaesibacter celericrescens]|uniref:Glycogen synthase n=1 Tax=Cohaesibacter celericrescens TaxID=2067669 RepID=A0A2N5XVZ2_9HYPH|nr:glycogen synthase GlgA [Cohaesibacter celericrescens]PLW78664.1 glycogen synthase GlgA [Cohaesibacter celericrescens]